MTASTSETFSEVQAVIFIATGALVPNAMRKSVMGEKERREEKKEMREERKEKQKELVRPAEREADRIPVGVTALRSGCLARPASLREENRSLREDKSARPPAKEPVLPRYRCPANLSSRWCAFPPSKRKELLGLDDVMGSTSAPDWVSRICSPEMSFQN